MMYTSQTERANTKLTDLPLRFSELSDLLQQMVEERAFQDHVSAPPERDPAITVANPRTDESFRKQKKRSEAE